MAPTRSRRSRSSPPRPTASSSAPASCSWPRERQPTPPCRPPGLTRWPAAAAPSQVLGARHSGRALGKHSDQRRTSVMRPPLRVGTVYDFRNTPESGMDMPNLYAAIMDQVVMLDGLGLDLVWFTEHHFLDDGYLPSWIPVASAMAARTKHARFSCDVCLLPF